MHRMKLLKTLRNDLIMVAVLCAAGYVAYQLLLDDKAKEGVSSMAHTVKDSYTQLSNLVNDRIGTIMDEDVVTQNRKDIKEAWAELGF